MSDERGRLVKKRFPWIRWLLLFLAFTLFSNARAEYFPWADFEHWRYGFPLLWLIHQLSSFAGPVDRWYVEYVNLAVNLVFWALTAFTVVYLTSRRARVG